MIPLPPDASLSQLAAYVHALEAHHGWLDATPSRCCFLMGEEVGELFKAVRNAERHTDVPPEARDAVAEEIVDVLNYLLAIANRYHIDLHAAFVAKNRRNELRTWAPEAIAGPGEGN